MVFAISVGYADYMNFWSGFYKAGALRKEVSCVAILQDGKILMGRRRDNQKFTNPGGHLEPGEDPADGAIREVKEEAGLDLDKSKLEHLVSKEVTTPKGERYLIHAYKYDLDEKQPTSMKEDPDAEVRVWKWLSMPLDREVLDNLHSPKNVLLDALGLSLSKQDLSEMERVGR